VTCVSGRVCIEAICTWVGRFLHGGRVRKQKAEGRDIKLHTYENWLTGDSRFDLQLTGTSVFLHHTMS
jgi:hypothetical protein